MVLEGRRISIEGVVQGVGFRPWVARLARRTGIAGRVRNGSSGVTIEAFGASPQLEAFQGPLKRSRPRAAAVHRMSVEPIPGQAVQSFVIEPSRDDPERRVSIPPDLPTCEVCLGEMADPSNRRFRYPFINCTQCGPRYTITRDVPYDRARTTMAAFEMCSECRAEYQAIEDRRYHAEPIACPRCGPRLVLLGPDGGDRQAADPIRAAGRRLIAGAIVAVKGLGGFHLAVDATQRATVRRLRRLKRRDQKPFAVMVRDLATAERLAFVGPVERKLLVSCERPVVLLRARPGIPITSEVAPGRAVERSARAGGEESRRDPAR